MRGFTWILLPLLLLLSTGCAREPIERSDSAIAANIRWKKLSSHTLQVDVAFTESTPSHGCLLEAFEAEHSVGFLRVKGQEGEHRVVTMSLDQASPAEDITDVRFTDCGT